MIFQGRTPANIKVMVDFKRQVERSHEEYKFLPAKNNLE
jgi:hypothetical protein